MVVNEKQRLAAGGVVRVVGLRHVRRERAADRLQAVVRLRGPAEGADEVARLRLHLAQKVELFWVLGNDGRSELVDAD